MSGSDDRHEETKDAEDAEDAFPSRSPAWRGWPDEPPPASPLPEPVASGDGAWMPSDAGDDPWTRAGWSPQPARASVPVEDDVWPAPSRQTLLPPSPPRPEAPGAPPAPPGDDHPPHGQSRNPVDRLTRNLPHPLRVTIDWVVTIVVAVGAVLAIKAWIVNPYRIPSSSMEPTLHCAQPQPGCLASYSDRVLANRFIYHFRDPHRGDIVVFNTPAKALEACGAGGTFVKRIIGLPGDTVEERGGTVLINGERLDEPYVPANERDDRTDSWKVPEGSYFMMGDNRSQSCDSREWGSVPRDDLIGPVFSVYWPPQRISFR